MEAYCSVRKVPVAQVSGKVFLNKFSLQGESLMQCKKSAHCLVSGILIYFYFSVKVESKHQILTNNTMLSCRKWDSFKRKAGKKINNFWSGKKRGKQGAGFLQLN